ncbi:MAG: hypothetical protein LBS48_01275 [Treponema sp.]|jgi:hypothetical protein|nr:hypothetical protein [Treponema sp.]
MENLVEAGRTINDLMQRSILRNQAKKSQKGGCNPPDQEFRHGPGRWGIVEGLGSLGGAAVSFAGRWKGSPSALKRDYFCDYSVKCRRMPV